MSKIKFRDNKTKDVLISPFYNIYQNDIVKMEFEYYEVTDYCPYSNQVYSEKVITYGYSYGIVDFDFHNGMFLKDGITIVEESDNRNIDEFERERLKDDFNYAQLWTFKRKKIKLKNCKIITNIHNEPNFIKNIKNDTREFAFVEGKYNGK